MAFRMTIGHPRPWPGYPHHTGLVSASYTSNPRFRHQLSSDPASRRAPLPRRMVPVITVHRGLTPLECDIILDTPGQEACPTRALSSAQHVSHEALLDRPVAENPSSFTAERSGRQESAE